MKDDGFLCYTEDEQNKNLSAIGALVNSDVHTVILFGGTFDPPHIGHLAMAQLALEQTQADEVWFLPAPSPPHKGDIRDDSFAWRVSMVEKLIGDRPSMRMMTLEERLPRPSYSVDTVRACQTWFEDIRFEFLIGSDSLAQLPTWHRADELVAAVEFLVAARSGYPFDSTLSDVLQVFPNLNANHVQMPLLDVSSTWLRDRLQQELDVFGLVPPEVMEVWRAGL